MSNKGCLLLFAAAALGAGVIFGPAHALANGRAPLPPLPEIGLLYSDRFDTAYNSGASNSPVTVGNYSFAESWSGYSLQRSGTLTPYVVNGVDGASHTNVTANGAVRCWFKPAWSSGAGPGTNAVLVELTAISNSQAVVVWSLEASADGTTLALLGQSAGGPAELLSADVHWQAGDSHLIALNYGIGGTALFIDGQLAAQGTGTSLFSPPNAGLTVGSTAAGAFPAQGDFDELYVFGRALTTNEVGSYYQVTSAQAALGPVTPEELAALQQAAAMRLLSGLGETAAADSLMGAGECGCCGLWLAISPTNNAVLLTLHNTRSNQYYTIWSITNLLLTNWVVETNLTATNDTAQVLIVMNGRSNVFFRASEVRDYTNILNLNGLNLADPVIEPPDTMGAVGPSHFVELLNGSIAVYDKSGSLISQTNTSGTNGFFAVHDPDGTNYPTGAHVVDNRILYDAQSQRWVACAIDAQTGPEQVILAVSNGDSPTNLVGGWTRYLLRVSQEGSDTDFTTLGLDGNGIYVRVVHRTLGSTNTLTGHTVVAIKKPEIYQGTNIATRLDIGTNVLPVWTMQPAVNFDTVATNDYAWFVAKGPPDLGSNYQGGALCYRRLQWTGTNAAWVDTNWLTVATNGVTNYRDYYDLDGTNVTVAGGSGVSAPEAVAQGGDSIELHEVGSRLAMTCIRNGYLWTCQAIGLSGTNGVYSGNVSGTNVDRSGAQWFKLKVDPVGGTLTYNTHGRVYDAAPTNAYYYYFPSLMVSCAGDMVMGFSGSSATNYISAFYTERLSNGYILSAPRLLQAGTAPHAGIRWGDYSATTLDPADDWIFWTVQEYEDVIDVPFPQNAWKTTIAKIRPNP